MDKVITSKHYKTKEIGALLEGKTAAERAVIKASELAKVELFDFKLDGYEVELFNLHEENGLLTVTVEASKDGKMLVLDNPFQFQNPPIMVSDGTYYKVRNDITGKEIKLPNSVENPEQALKEIIINTIKAVDK